MLTYADKLKTARRRLKLTQNEVGQIFGRHIITVTVWEGGKEPSDRDKVLIDCLWKINLMAKRNRVPDLKGLLARRGAIYCLSRILAA